MKHKTKFEKILSLLESNVHNFKKILVSLIVIKGIHKDLGTYITKQPEQKAGNEKLRIQIKDKEKTSRKCELK